MTVAHTSSRRRGLAVSACYVLVAAWAGRRGLPVVCPYRRVTGHGCPVCGLTRSLSAAVHGDLRASAEAHPLGPWLLAGLAVGLLAELARSRAGAARSASLACHNRHVVMLSPRRRVARPE
jgi:hypothetical protein